MIEKITTNTEDIHLMKEGIVFCKAHNNVLMNLEDAKENIEAVAQLAQGEKVLVIVDIRNSKGATKEGRRYFASERAAEVQKGCALIIDSPLSKLIGNFFIGMNKPAFPTKLFTNQEQALIWLKEL